MKTKLIVLFIFTLLFSVQALAQRLSYGPVAGLLFDNPTGSVLLDSIQVTLQGDNDRQPYIGGYLSYELNKTFTITSGITYYNSYKGATVYSTEKQGFERLIHATFAGNRSLEVPVLLETKLPVWHGTLFVMAGVSSHVRLSRYRPDYFTNKFVSPAMSEAIYNFESVMKPVVWNYTLGVGAKVWRLRLEAKWQYDLANSATKHYEVWGNRYNFKSRNNSIRFGVGYNLNWRNKE